MIKKIVSLLAVMVFVLSMTACSSSDKSSTDSSSTNETDSSSVVESSIQSAAESASGSTSTDDFSGTKLMISMCYRDQFTTSIETAAKAYAESVGIELDIQDAESDITKQLSHVTTAATGDYDGLVVIPVNTDSSGEIIANAGDLPIVFANLNPGSTNLEADKYVYVGSDEHYSGGYQAEFLAKYFKEKNMTEVNAVLFTGLPGQEAQLTRTESVKAGLEDAGIKVNYVFEDTAEWDRAKAQEKMIQFLGTNKEFDCVIANNDEMALGVIEAMNMQGLDPSSIPIVGIDATQVACEAIKEGTMAFSVYQSAPGQGEGAVKAAALITNGRSVAELEGINEDNTILWIPFEPVDSSNVDDYMQ